MKVDITRLLNRSISSLSVEDSVTIPSELLIDTRINSLENIIFKGKLSLDEEDNVLIEGNIKGTMNLSDDITLKPVAYNFNSEIEENLPNCQNILDITDVLWQNIYVEVPSKVRSTNEDIELTGDGWRVISEEKFQEEQNITNNPFANLEELLKTKEDK